MDHLRENEEEGEEEKRERERDHVTLRVSSLVKNHTKHIEHLLVRLHCDVFVIV